MQISGNEGVILRIGAVAAPLTGFAATAPTRIHGVGRANLNRPGWTKMAR
jgi:hypothetical protein